jgi:hypothetical protein
VNAPGANIAGWWDGGATAEFAGRPSTPERTRSAYDQPTPDTPAEPVLIRLIRVFCPR